MRIFRCELEKERKARKREGSSDLGQGVDENLDLAVDVPDETDNLRLGIEDLDALRVGVVADAKRARDPRRVRPVEQSGACVIPLQGRLFLTF